MIGLFCGTSTSTNEEYRKVIKNKMNMFIIIAILGVITEAVTLAAKNYWKVNISDQMLGTYTGAGVGLIAVSLILYVKNRMLLNNEEKLKESRIAHTDERNKQLSSSAFRVATVVMLITLYAVAFIGGLWYPVLTEALLIIVSMFLLAYLVAYQVISKRI